MRETRRRFLGRSLGAGALLALGAGREPREARLGRVPFLEEGTADLSQVSGRGLDGRLAFDLTRLTESTLITPSRDFYIRTREPGQLERRLPWTIRVRGRVAHPLRLTMEILDRRAKAQGTHLLECSGNSPYRAFGLMSAARWSGVPLADLIREARPQDGAARVVVRGVDPGSQSAPGSGAWAGWSFSLEEVERYRLFLATRMNGRPLSRDHGWPVRLVAPGWYGCCCIKWVEELDITGADAPATGQMREYATRTHQVGIPRLAGDFQPALIDTAAMPVRVEKWRVGEDIEYRVTGILWGGQKPVRRLSIRFNPETPFRRVSGLRQRTTHTWTLWHYRWRPARPGRYQIALRVEDEGVRTRRLDMGYYVRSVRIEEV